MHIDFQHPPDHITAFTEVGEHAVPAKGIEVALTPGPIGTAVTVRSPQEKLLRICLRWRGAVDPATRFLGDAWERGYGDLEWRSIVPQRVMPWYVLAHTRTGTHGFGVKTQPGAFCFWTVDSDGACLWLDVRNGGRGVELGDRTLTAATIVTRQGSADESAVEASRACYRLMCDTPILPAHPVYGSNNWYYAYGRSSHEQILRDAELLVSLSPAGSNRPYMVIDAGWSPEGSSLGSTWDRGNSDFPDMPRLAEEMRSRGARP